MKNFLNQPGIEPPTSIYCRCPAREICVGVNFSYGDVMHPPICTSVPSLVSIAQKLTKPEDPTYSKSPLVWHVHLAPLGIGDSKSTYQRLMATCLPGLVHVRQLVWPAGSSNSLMYCILCKYLHVHCTCSMPSR